MKMLVRVMSVSALVAFLAGCACNDYAYAPKIPQAVQAKILDYNAQPGNKVFVVAIDACGDYAFGYDFGKATLDEARRVAIEKCDASRASSGVKALATIYAINDDVVYEKMIDARFKREQDRKATSCK